MDKLLKKPAKYLTLAQKVQLIRLHECHRDFNIPKLAEYYGVGKAQVSRILGRKDAYMKEWKSNRMPQAKRTGVNPRRVAVDIIAFEGLRRLLSTPEMAINEVFIRLYAKQVAQALRVEEFCGNARWLKSFRTKCFFTDALLNDKSDLRDILLNIPKKSLEMEDIIRDMTNEMAAFSNGVLEKPVAANESKRLTEYDTADLKLFEATKNSEFKKLFKGLTVMMTTVDATKTNEGNGEGAAVATAAVSISHPEPESSPSSFNYTPSEDDGIDMSDVSLPEPEISLTVMDYNNQNEENADDMADVVSSGNANADILDTVNYDEILIEDVSIFVPKRNANSLQNNQSENDDDDDNGNEQSLSNRSISSLQEALQHLLYVEKYALMRNNLKAVNLISQLECALANGGSS